MLCPAQLISSQIKLANCGVEPFRKSSSASYICLLLPRARDDRFPKINVSAFSASSALTWLPNHFLGKLLSFHLTMKLHQISRKRSTSDEKKIIDLHVISVQTKRGVNDKDRFILSHKLVNLIGNDLKSENRQKTVPILDESLFNLQN